MHWKWIKNDPPCIRSPATPSHPHPGASSPWRRPRFVLTVLQVLHVYTTYKFPRMTLFIKTKQAVFLSEAVRRCCSDGEDRRDGKERATVSFRVQHSTLIDIRHFSGALFWIACFSLLIRVSLANCIFWWPFWMAAFFFGISFFEERPCQTKCWSLDVLMSFFLALLLIIMLDFTCWFKIKYYTGIIRFFFDEPFCGSVVFT